MGEGSVPPFGDSPNAPEAPSRRVRAFHGVVHNERQYAAVVKNDSEAMQPNFQHLHYFTVIAQEGGVAAAGRRLRLTHSTLSAQLGAFERWLGAQLFLRRGGKLHLTDVGHEVLAYGEDVLKLGAELVDVVHGARQSTRVALRAGVAPGVPKSLAFRFLAPARDGVNDAVLQVRNVSEARVVEELAGGRLHMALTDVVPAPLLGVRVHAHSLGATNISWFAPRPLAKKLRRTYPRSLTGAPVVLPASGGLRLSLDAWLAKHRIVPAVQAEVDDASLIRLFGARGWGAFPVRDVLRDEVLQLGTVEHVGACAGVEEQYFAITMERKVRHRAVAAIIDGAREGLRRA